MIKKYVTDIHNNIYLKEENVSEIIKDSNNAIEITNEEITKFSGFGSAITESSAYNYQKLSLENKKKFINDYFSKDGLNYSFSRISIGSNDFSLNSYSYSQKRDLSDFSISHDKDMIIPFLKDIKKTKDIYLIASPWSPPKMYKKIPVLFWGIKLRKKYYEKYSEYLLKFIKEYQKEKLNINYLTMQNEPTARQRWESCIFTIKEQKEFIYHYLLNKLDNTKLLLWDHNKDNLFNIINELYIESDKISGFAFHYYTGSNFLELVKLRKKYPDKLLVNTEMCCAYAPLDKNNWLSSAEYYLNDIIGDMNSGVNAYLDWNILLDHRGGPTYKNNPVKSASIRVDDTYIKSPIYYYLYHVSHFINNSIIIKNINNTNLKVVSVKTNNNIIIVIMNKTNNDIEYNLLVKDKKVFDRVNSHTIVTYEIN